jgi:hypothetical protein
MLLRICLSIVFVFPIFCFGQEIKVKVQVQESGSEIRPDAQKEEKFEEARFFLYGGAGFGIRQGKITTGFIKGEGSGQIIDPNNTDNQTTNESKPFKNGFYSELGCRFFLKNNFGLGAKGSLFVNNAEFRNITDESNSSAATYLYGGAIEGLYRIYFEKDEKTIFCYTGLSLGVSIIDQKQTYRFRTPTFVNQAFFTVRPTIGIQIPVWDIFHVYVETGYNFAEGKISAGSLSLSQYQASAGIQIRLNSF